MKNEATKDLTYYRGLAYTTILRRDEDGDFVSTISEFPGCMAHGNSELEALANLWNVRDAWLEMRLAQGLSIPEPTTVEDSLPSGRWVQRVPRSLHLQLTLQAKREQVSLNQFVTAMLAGALAVRSLPAKKSAVSSIPARSSTASGQKRTRAE